MKNLAGIPTPTANLFVSVELAKAGVSAFEIDVQRDGEVKASLIGVFATSSGQEVVCRRAWYYWVVSLKQPLSYEDAKRLNEKWAGKVRVDGYAGGKEPGKHGVYHYHVDTQDGLNALFMELKAVCGQQCEVQTRPGSLSSFLTGELKDWARPNLRWHQPPANAEDLARSEIAALINLGGDTDHLVTFAEEALSVATRTFGKKSEEARATRILIADRLRDGVRGTKRILEVLTSEHDVFGYTWILESQLTKRIKVLWALGRGKEARSVKANCEEVRKDFITRLEKQIAHYQTELHEEPYSVAEHTRFQIASYTAKLSLVQKSLKQLGEAEASWTSLLPRIPREKHSPLDA